MKILEYPKYLHVILQPGDTLDKHLLLGWKQKKNDPRIIAENNLVNRLVLGLPLRLKHAHAPMRYSEGLETYQVKDVDAMLSCDYILNANPMGLGKTPETVRYMKELGVQTALIVVPKIIRNQWVAQLKAWGDFDATIYEKQPYITEGIWIVNYEKLRNESTREKFQRFAWDVLVLDEAHRIKNRGASQTKAVMSLPARRRVALTGTPILRYVDDLWSILNFLDVSYSGISYWNFRDYFCKIDHTPWGDKIVGLTTDTSRVAILNTLMALVSIRNESVEVAQGKIRTTVLLPMTKKQRDLYRKEKQLLLDELPENCTIANGVSLTLRLRQTTSWPGLFLTGEAGPKFEWVLETCKDNPCEKFVVFTVFEQTASALTRYLESNKVSAVVISGKNSSKENENNKRKFVDKETQVLIGTIGAMSQGYDELQYVSRLMIVLDRDWSPEIMNQAEDRLHRRGQKLPVTIYYLECQGSFDQHVGRINQNKADGIREALQSEEYSNI